ncbi:MAG: hypothetical protein KQH83_12385 [Actinobacteria bacterium]|nr:hypothetical protein [Actinomycetota bacterium]
MKVMRGDPASWDAGGPHAVTIGVFDGVHRGHHHVISLTRGHAGRLGARSGLVTFDRHPLTVLAPEHAPPLLTSLDRRLELFEAAGLDTVGILPFEDWVRDMSPEAFVLTAVVAGFSARMVVVGEDFRFGKDRAGNVHVLATVGAEMGFEVEAVSLLSDDGLVSSSRIRAMVAAGDVEAAAGALGRRFEVHGRVARRAGQGEWMGVPVADVAADPGLAVPGPGVYAVRAAVDGGSRAGGAAYLRGPDDGEPGLIQFHLLEGSMDLDGAAVRLEFVARIRGDERFAGAEALRTAVEADLDAARRLLTQAP